MMPEIKRKFSFSLLLVNIAVIIFLFGCSPKPSYEYSTYEGKTEEGISYKTYDFKGKLPPISAEGTMSFLNRYEVNKILRYLDLPDTNDNFLREKEDGKFYYEKYSLGTLIFEVKFGEFGFSPKSVKRIIIMKDK